MSQQVLLLCSRRPIISEFDILAKTFVEVGITPIFVCVRPGSSKFLQGLTCDSEIVDLTRNEHLTGAEQLLHIVFGMLRVASRAAARLRLRTLSDFMATYEAVQQGRWMCRRYLRVNPNIAAVLIADDRDIRQDAGFIKSAGETGIPSIVVQFGRADASADLRRRMNDPTFRGSGAIRSAIFAEKDLKNDPVNERVSFLSFGEHLAMSLAGAPLSAPWSYGGGNANYVAAIDAAEAQKMLDAGVDKSKVFVSGQPSYDQLWSSRSRSQEIRDHLYAEHGFDRTQQLVICALPVLGEHGMSAQPDQLLDSEIIFKRLKEVSNNVLISLHPRQRLEDYVHLAENAGVSIAHQPLREIVVAADLFVAYSTTLQWASLLSIPAIALEHYNLGYLLFDNLPGVHVNTDIDELPGLARSLMLNDRGDRNSSTVLDGQSCRRIVDLCIRII